MWSKMVGGYLKKTLYYLAVNPKGTWALLESNPGSNRVDAFTVIKAVLLDCLSFFITGTLYGFQNSLPAFQVQIPKDKGFAVLFRQASVHVQIEFEVSKI